MVLVAFQPIRQVKARAKHFLASSYSDQNPWSLACRLTFNLIKDGKEAIDAIKVEHEVSLVVQHDVVNRAITHITNLLFSHLLNDLTQAAATTTHF